MEICKCDINQQLVLSSCQTEISVNLESNQASSSPCCWVPTDAIPKLPTLCLITNCSREHRPTIQQKMATSRTPFSLLSTKDLDVYSCTSASQMLDCADRSSWPPGSGPLCCCYWLWGVGVGVTFSPLPPLCSLSLLFPRLPLLLRLRL